MHAGADGWKSFAMWTAWTAYICFAIAFTLARSDGPSGQGFSSLRVETLLSKMTLEDKVGQMTQVDIGLFVDSETGVLDEQKLTEFVTRYRIGSLFNTPFGRSGGWKASEWRHIIRRAQQIAEGAGSKLPLLIGLDSVHGANYVEGAVIFPQQINLAATFNPALAREAGRVAARDSRAAAVPWLFAPILGLATQPLWPRVYETFGEDPLLASRMGEALVKGIQTSQEWGGGDADGDGEPLRAAACMKHFVGYSHPSAGHDRSPTRIPEQELLEMYLPPFQAAVDAGVSSAMESYNSLNSIPLASSRRYLVDVLRGRMGFLGMLVTDYAEIANLEYHHRVSGGPEDSVFMAMEDTSIDMSMVPLDASFADTLLGLVRGGKVSQNRIERSVRRVLALKKEKLGLLDNPVPGLHSTLLREVGSEQDHAAALQAARESITLLKNGDMPTREGAEEEEQEKEESPAVTEKALPLDRSAMSKLLLVGPACDSLVLQSGGWTKHWQGASRPSEFSADEGMTILQGVRAFLDGSLDTEAGAEGKEPSTAEVDGSSEEEQQEQQQEKVSPVDVVFKKGIRVDGSNEPDRDQALSEAFSADAIVACFGEPAYTEKPGDISELDLPPGISAFVKELRKVSDGMTPIILALVEGRPRLLGDLPQDVDAVMHTYLLGPSGGQAVAEVLFGAVNPSGRLPITYPRHSGNIPMPYHHLVSDTCQTQTGEGECDVEWWFGEGLSYTSFDYTALSVEPERIHEGQKFKVSLLVTNTGSRAGDDSVLLFATDLVRRVEPRYKMLKGFDKVSLEPGESKKVTFDLTSKDLEYVGTDLRTVLEAGDFLFGVGHTSDCRTEPDGCAALTVVVSDDYQPACEAACSLWFPPDDAAPGGYVCPREAELAFESNSESECLDECVQAAWGWGYVSCLEQAVWTGTCSFNQQCRAVGKATVPPPAAPDGGRGRNSSSITNIGGPATSTAALRPRTGSVDLAVGVGVGLCLGGAAVFVVLMTRFKRAPRWPHQTGQGGRGFGYDGVRLHGGGAGAGRAGRGGAEGGVARWPRRQTEGFPIRGRRGRGGGRGAKSGPKAVGLELDRVGFDYDRGVGVLELRDDGDRGRDQDYGAGGGSSDRVLGVHRRPGSGDGGGGIGLVPTRSWEGRRAG
ncbi:unnamed protein product, partial [Scytosiphon promiscuus]